jgi:hypothetical protein
MEYAGALPDVPEHLNMQMPKRVVVQLRVRPTGARVAMQFAVPVGAALTRSYMRGSN